MLLVVVVHVMCALEQRSQGDGGAESEARMQRSLVVRQVSQAGKALVSRRSGFGLGLALGDGWGFCGPIFFGGGEIELNGGDIAWRFFGKVRMDD